MDCRGETCGAVPRKSLYGAFVTNCEPGAGVGQNEDGEPLHCEDSKNNGSDGDVLHVRSSEVGGAGGGNRTHTSLVRTSDFKSDASASSATPAHL